MALFEPGRRLRRSVECQRGRLSISDIARTEGIYELEFHSCDGQYETEFKISLDPVRVPTADDRARVDAERKVDEADRLVLSKPLESRPALAIYDGARLVWKARGDHEEEMRVLHRMGILSRDLGDAAKAHQYLKQALEISEATRNEIERSAILRSIATVHFRSREATQALDYGSRALEISRSSSDQNGVAESLIVIGDVHYFSGNFPEAREAYIQAFTIWESIHYRRGQAKAMLYIAQVDSDRNDFTQALSRLQESRALYDAVGDGLGSAKGSALLGHVLSSTGYKQQALDVLEGAKSTLSTDPTSEATLMNTIARIHADLGDYNTAIPFSKRALGIHTALGDQVAVAFESHATGLYYFAAGDVANARAVLERARDAFHSLGNERSEAESWLALGMVNQSQGQAQLAAENLTQALDMSHKSGDRRLEAAALLGSGQLHYRSGELEKALAQYNEARQLYKATEDTFGELSTLYQISICLQRMGDLDRSIAASEAALEIVEKLRTTLVGSALRAFFFASAKQQVDVYVDSLMRKKDSMKAFEISDRARARTLQDRISETRLAISEGIDSALSNNMTSLRAAIEGKSEEYSELLSKNLDSVERMRLSDELRRLEADLDLVEGQLRTRNPRYAEFAKPQPLTLDQIRQQVLDSKSLLLEFALGEENSYLWAVTKDSFDSYVLPRKSEIEKKVVELLKLVTSPPSSRSDTEYARYASDLSRILLGPVSEKLGSRQLIIVADGALQYLPFAALPTPQTAAQGTPTWLIAEHSIAIQPSASTIAVLRKSQRATRPDRTIAVLADPVYQRSDSRCMRLPSCASALRTPAPKITAVKASSPVSPLRSGAALNSDLPRLSATGREADAIKTLVAPEEHFEARGFKATKAAAMSADVARARIVHFAAHTRLDDDHPDLSSLVLSLIDERGNKQNGYLRLGDMYNLKLSAELVVLSACETALGKEIKGEGLMSMVRGFMYAGTPRVLASLWKVSDDATAELMDEFYKQLLVEKQPAAEALRQAQIKQMNKKNRQSPFNWAAFQLSGEWN